MEKFYKKGEIHPTTGNIFWSYSDNQKTKEGWLTPESFKRKNEKHKSYYKSETGKKYQRDYYLKNKDAVLKRTKQNKNKRAERHPLMLILATCRNAAKRRGIQFNISIDDLLDKWEKQNGKCYYTGIEMIKTFRKKCPTQVSVDRINTKEGYLKENIALCCLSINYAKNSFDESQINDFLSKIKST